VAAILGQEHHCAGHEWVDFKGEAKKAGWTMTGAAAVSNKSAGASLAVRSIYHSGLTKGAREDCSPKESPERLATGWVDGVLKKGILVLSIYLWHAEGLTARNQAILFAAGNIIKRHGGRGCWAGTLTPHPKTLNS